MSKEEGLSLEQMREERGTFEAVYIQFVNNRKYYATYAFCFFEGEDGKYYNSRIEHKFGDKFLTYTVGNKKEVLKLFNRISTSGLYDNVCTMFFVDRDYDISKKDEHEDLYETPCYSIENLYTQKECLSKILQSEFGLNEIDEDFKKCVSDFEIRLQEFNQEVLEFNALAYLRRKKSDSNSNCSFGSVKTSHIANVAVNAVCRSTKYNEVMEQIKEKLEFEECELETAKQELVELGEYTLNFRGKNQLDFFVEFVKGLKMLNKAGGYFSTKYNNIHINITSNRLSELSQYAITPICLEEFLENHKTQFAALSAG